ncbi:MAG: NAD(P)-dependent oxidoreductase, partial [Rhizobiaceae bacterium]|nr:NAD(P)-dependent oxidoreductase [Rhizobiaceae bacterium]
MRVVLTGGGGFLGSHVARVLLRQGAFTDSSGRTREISELVVADLNAVSQPWAQDERVRQVVGDITSHQILESVITPECGTVFHFAAMLKADAS